ncbi:hypothetical protein [Hymenobacter antarcticus]|uniref:SpoIIAA-like n=1 Tax=Hymenobacter antarcticus TaxID=486270 RepID=A0ABP7PT09_9BACT
MRLYFENPIGRVLEDPNGYALVQYAAGPRDFATFQAFLTHTHQLLRRHGWHKMLADQRHMTPYTEQERAWIADHWLAQSADDGYPLFGAIIIASDVYAHLAPVPTMDAVRHQSALTYRIFEAEQDATNWLAQQ